MCRVQHCVLFLHNGDCVRWPPVRPPDLVPLDRWLTLEVVTVGRFPVACMSCRLRLVRSDRVLLSCTPSLDISVYVCSFLSLYPPARTHTHTHTHTYTPSR